MSDQEVEAVDSSELDLDHDGAVDEQPSPLTDDELLVIDPGPEGEG
ncbi:MAG: hypothetical protein ACRDZW_03290 [Acidimicrobiales bacterium]